MSISTYINISSFSYSPIFVNSIADDGRLNLKLRLQTRSTRIDVDFVFHTRPPAMTAVPIVLDEGQKSSTRVHFFPQSPLGLGLIPGPRHHCERPFSAHSRVPLPSKEGCGSAFQQDVAGSSSDKSQNRVPLRAQSWSLLTANRSLALTVADCARCTCANPGPSLPLYSSHAAALVSVSWCSTRHVRVIVMEVKRMRRQQLSKCMLSGWMNTSPVAMRWCWWSSLARSPRWR